jgi:hypothetical protein
MKFIMKFLDEISISFILYFFFPNIVSQYIK